jgi:hypothetical protein
MTKFQINNENWNIAPRNVGEPRRGLPDAAATEGCPTHSNLADCVTKGEMSSIEKIEEKIANSYNHHHGRITYLAVISPTDLLIRYPFIIGYSDYIC